ncbi:MAG: flavin reductase family protein [Bacteroidota bacterium]|nr:flavin reductase family protein [Bacteroidota bacterium]
MIKPKKFSVEKGNYLYPLPAVLVSCGKTKSEANLITISWTGTINSEPPMLYISIRKNRHSYDIIKRHHEFVINLTDKTMLEAVDFNGVKSGRDYDKFKESNFTPGASQKIDTLLIQEAPVNIECKVNRVLSLGSHDMFIADVVNVQAVENYINKKTGKIDFTGNELLSYANKNYYSIGESLERVGFSVKK